MGQLRRGQPVKRDFLTHPADWTRTRRGASSYVDEACSLYVYERQHRIADAAIAIGFVAFVVACYIGVV